MCASVVSSCICVDERNILIRGCYTTETTQWKAAAEELALKGPGFLVARKRHLLDPTELTCRPLVPHRSTNGFLRSTFSPFF